MPTRMAFAQNSTWRRDHRSSKTPANGPMKENGNRSVANAAAIAGALVCRSGAKNTYDANATWNTPSASCEVSRTA